MKHKYKPGDMFEMQRFTTKSCKFSEEIIIIVELAETETLSGPHYKVYNQTYSMFMDRTEVFLDKFYKKVG